MSGPQTSEMSLVVNGRAHCVGAGCTVAALLEGLGLADARIAVAVNRDVVPRSRFTGRRLADGDRIEILEAVGGG